MSDFKHRNVKELKQFIKKYNDHFRIMLTNKKKQDLVKAINQGMKKTVDDKLKKDYDMLSLKPIKSKPLEKPVEKPKSELPTRKTRVVKSEPIRSIPAPKPQRKIPKNRRGGIPDIDQEISSLMKTSKKLEKKQTPKKEFKLAPARPIGTVAKPSKKSPIANMKITPKKDDVVEGFKSMVKSSEKKDKTKKINSTMYKEIIDSMKTLLSNRTNLAKINQLADDGKSFGKIKNLKEWFDERFIRFRELDNEIEKLFKKNKNVKMTSEQERTYSKVQDFFESNRFYSN